jgi:colicin import membrane protein
MVENRYQRHNAGLHPDPKIGRYFLFSLVLHLVVVLVFSGVFVSRPVREHRPVYYVDLSRLPVANPRAGRPDGSLQAGSKAAASKPAAPAPAKAATPAPAKATTPAPKPAKPAKTVAAKPEVSRTEPVKKPDSSAATRSNKTASGKGATEKSYQQTLKAMEAMREKVRRQQEIDALKERIAALGASDSRAGGGSGGGAGDVPLGMPDGKGTEAGVSQELWLQTWLKENWSFSRYQASRRDLVATTRITYDAEGNLAGYQFLKKSGDNNFDDSVTKAILKSRQLAFKPGRRFEVDVEFNLKDLKE